MQLRMPFRSPWKLIALLVASAFLLSFSADAHGAPVKEPTKKSVKKKTRVAKRQPIYGPLAVTSPPALPPAPQAAPVAPALSASAEETTKRILNFRLHPLYLVQMMTNKDTVAAVRGDLEFVLGDKLALGPSVIYQQKSLLDDQALASGSGQLMNESYLEVGLLSSIYLTGTTSTGGFILRPHLYWIDVQGEKTNGDGATVAPSSQTTSGLRGGAEFVYQKILSNGFNFEVGGGFTYHLIPYAIEYPQGGITRSEPDSRIQPSVSLAIGWAF